MTFQDVSQKFSHPKTSENPSKTRVSQRTRCVNALFRGYASKLGASLPADNPSRPQPSCSLTLCQRSQALHAPALFIDILSALTLCQRTMANLENRVAGADRRSLSKRIDRQQKVIGVMRGTQPAQMLLHLRREERTLHRHMLAAPDDATLCSLVSAAATVRNQILDLISWPKRPASAPMKPGGRPLIPVDAMPVDVAEVIRAEEAADQPDTGS